MKEGRKYEVHNHMKVVGWGSDLEEVVTEAVGQGYTEGLVVADDGQVFDIYSLAEKFELI